MKAVLISVILALTLALQLAAQKGCLQSSYYQQELKNNSRLQEYRKVIEPFTRQYITNGNTPGIATESNIIRIPVVIHNLYHFPEERISDEQVASQLALLNKCFRRQDANAENIPVYFKPLAADIEIEFVLAISDPRRRATTGILRKYTPIKTWTTDDKVKFAAEMGSDAWDTKKYLNIWVCNLGDFAGYSSFPGGPDNKDGIVIGLPAFGSTNKTLVHEAGHWLNLKHLWGDEYCGDDGVTDTPKQASYTMGCPTGIRLTCGNSVTGDMYMNYMDFTSDECISMFTEGQKARMRTLFEGGGPRNSVLSSTGLSMPLIFEAPLPDESPTWLKPNLYPNPATTTMTLDLSYDIRWMGKTIFIMNIQGQTVMTVVITAKMQVINISRLQPGMYFLAAKKDDGESIKQKFIKL